MAKSKKTKTVLIVEDETSERRALADKLKRKKYTVLQAENGLDGLQTALRKKPDIILLDILMPGIDGLKFMQKLRADKWGQKAAVMVLTNLEAERKMLNFFKRDHRCAHYLIKSDWKLSEIVKKIEKTLK